MIFFSKTALTIFLVFGLKLVLNMKNFKKILQFGPIWPRNRQIIAQIEVFGHFLDFTSLVFLDFAHNDRWAWCLVVFLQFAGPVSVFLFFLVLFISFIVGLLYWTSQCKCNYLIIIALIIILRFIVLLSIVFIITMTLPDFRLSCKILSGNRTKYISIFTIFHRSF